MSRLLAVAWKELIQLRRDRMTFGMMIGMPIMQLLLFGYAINTDVRRMPTVVYDADRSSEARAWVARLRVTGSYEILGSVPDYGALRTALRRGDAAVGVVVPRGFGSALREGRTASTQILIDGADPQTVAGAIQTASGVAADWTSAVHPAHASIAVTPSTLYNPEGRTAVFVVPGLVGVILTMTMLMFTSMALVRERERGTLEQLIVSPIRPHELALGKILPYVVIGYLQMTLILALGRFGFHVPIRGALGLLFALAAAFIGANLALGLLFSTVARTQQQAMQMSFFFLLPNILLSGFAFPFAGMPRPAQWLAECLPLTHFLRIVRGILLKGATFAEVRTEFGWLLLILVVLLAAASLRTSKRLG